MLDDEHYMDKWAEAENDTSSRQHRSFIRLVYFFLLYWYQVMTWNLRFSFQEGPCKQIFFLVFDR